MGFLRMPGREGRLGGVQDGGSGRIGLRLRRLKFGDVAGRGRYMFLYGKERANDGSEAEAQRKAWQWEEREAMLRRQVNLGKDIEANRVCIPCASSEI
jgi:hypothetical protein